MSSSQFAAFGPRNYRLMWVGIAVLAAGFITMTLDTAEYGEGFLGITLGPILLIIGFIIEFFAIMLRDATVVTQAAPSTGTAPAPTFVPATPLAAGSQAPPTAAPIRPSYKPL